jgi:Fe-S-cluster containining protein
MTETGLRFQCQPGCIRCCDTRGFVYLTEQDLERAAEYTGLTPAGFESQYVYRTKHLIRLRKPAGRQCHFLADGGCRIHPVKPTQCRLFPFWPELVADRTLWKDAGRRCPGIGQGDLVQIGTAIEIASEMEHAYPSFYGLA